MTREDYIDAHIDAEPPALSALYRATQLGRLYPRMCSDNAQGRLLAMLVRMIRPGRILELGAFTGYSALAMAAAMPEGCTLDTVEIDSDYADELAATLAAGERGGDITLHIGDALEVAPELCRSGRPVDLVFIDANKRHYHLYYKALLPLLPSGAFIIADNTLWSDKILNADSAGSDPQTAGIALFNDLVAADDSVEKIIIPLRDGLTIIRKK